MCGITAFFARESTPDIKHLDMLFTGAEKRGQDGFGFVIIRNEKNGRHIRTVFKDHRKYSDCREDVLNVFKNEPLGIGDAVIAICRASPETEPATDPLRVNETVQPIVNLDEGLVVAHNGAVSQKIYNELKNWSGDDDDESTPVAYKYGTDIDSEALICNYIKHGRNMKDCMESLSGGFAAIMYDQNKDMLYVMNDHMQISHGYVRGLGFFLHSDVELLRDVIHDYTGCSRDGVNMWECYYAHYLSGGRIKQIDLQSGFMQNIKYTPRYITPAFDTIKGVIK